MIMWGWGAMNPTAVQEAAKTGYPEDHFIGVWWSGSEDDARPAGPGGKGYLVDELQRRGRQLPRDPGHRQGRDRQGRSPDHPKDKVGENFYNRGVMNAVVIAEAIRHAQKITGKKDITGEEMRRGLETLQITPERWKEMGLPGFGRPDPRDLRRPQWPWLSLYAAVGQHQVGQGLRLDRAHEGQGCSAGR